MSQWCVEITLEQDYHVPIEQGSIIIANLLLVLLYPLFLYHCSSPPLSHYLYKWLYYGSRDIVSDVVLVFVQVYTWTVWLVLLWLQPLPHLFRGALECGLSVLLHACASSLLSLSITNCSLLLTERSLWLASSLCPQLLHLHYTSEEFPPTPASIWCLASGCPHLLTLSLPPSLHSEMVERFTDACLQQISLGFPHLQCVRLGGSAISVNGLREISECSWS